MSKIKKYMPKVLSGVLSLTILCCTIGVASYSAGAKSTGAETTNTNISDTSSNVKSVSEDKTKKLSKNETVYVIANADGSAKKVIVSDWIKNTAKAKSFGDISNLDNIVNVKGDETYTVNENNMYEWSADGNDIYYQGTGKSELPVGLSVSYTLDGKKISADKLAGQSGKVKIRFDYTNRQSEKIKIDGKEEEIYVPFVMLTGMMLDNDVFRNVEVSNGKVINDGSHTYVAGFALPKMQSNLNIDSKDFEIPEYVEITADVKNFELATTLTLAANDMFSDVDFSKVDDKIDSLSDSLDELTDAANQLIDGSSQLYDGLKTLLDKSGELIEGVEQLYDGAEKISSGAQELDNGAGALASGAKDLDNGVGTLKDGADSLDSGVSSLNDGAISLDSGVSQLQGYVATLSSGLNTISGNSESLNAGAKQIFDTLLATADTQIAAAGLQADKLTISNYAQVLDKLVGSLSEDNVKTVAYNTALETVTTTVNSQKDVIREAVESAVRKQVTESVLASAGYSMSAEQYDSAIASGQIPDEVQVQINTAVSTQMSSSSIQSTIDINTQSQIQSLIDTNMQSDEVQSQINSAVEKASAGKNSLSSLKEQLDNYNIFYQGVLTYTDGVDKANAGAQQILGGTNTLKEGSYTLKNGSKQLKSGSGSLKDGAGTLKDGADSLNSGAQSLKDGTSELNSGAKNLVQGVASLKEGSSAFVSGVKQLNDGSMTLNDGLKKFKEDGIDVLVDAVGGDVNGLVSRLKAVSEVSSHYKSYSGISDEMDGKVDFIYKTDSIEK
ncbi:MAG: hypothetical protein ACI4FO_09405 [Acutalibacteraceae bacterium]